MTPFHSQTTTVLAPGESGGKGGKGGGGGDGNGEGGGGEGDGGGGDGGGGDGDGGGGDGDGGGGLGDGGGGEGEGGGGDGDGGGGDGDGGGGDGDGGGGLGDGGGGDGDGGGGLGDGDGGGEGGDEGGIIPTNLWMALSSAAWSFSIVSSFACMNPSSSKHVQVDGSEPARDPEPSTVAAPNLGAGDDIKVAAPTQSSMQKAARYLSRRGLIICGCREGVRRALYIGKREGIQLRFVCARACRFWACFSRRGLFRACFSPATDDENSAG